jgi:hypothetical protein
VASPRRALPAEAEFVAPIPLVTAEETDIVLAALGVVVPTSSWPATYEVLLLRMSGSTLRAQGGSPRRVRVLLSLRTSRKEGERANEPRMASIHGALTS